MISTLILPVRHPCSDFGIGAPFAGALPFLHWSLRSASENKNPSEKQQSSPKPKTMLKIENPLGIYKNKLLLCLSVHSNLNEPRYSFSYDKETMNSYTIAASPNLEPVVQWSSFIYSTFDNLSKSSLDIDGKTPFLSSKGLNTTMIECICFYSQLHLQPRIILLHLSIQICFYVIIF